ncbi:MAG TPA: aminotransferase class I/II-fold pyridoxal phosphate-dependent enzyme [Nevskiaceae bacterium]
MHIETLAVHAGHAPEASGAVAPSMVPSTTFAREPDGSQPAGYKYGRMDNPNRRALEACLAQLEGGAEAIAFSAGVAACAAVLSALRPGDHLLAPLDVYVGNRLLMNEEFKAWGLAVDFVDFTDLDAVRRALRPQTKLLWAETPSNPLMQIEDIAALADIAHRGGARLAVDNTFATPVLQHPLALGADYAVHSSSKYFGGHSDVIGGAVIAARDDAYTQRVRLHQSTAGSIPAPFDCWMLLRSISTLPLRVRAQTASADAIARFLDAHPGVSKVHYPGLSTHPGHALAARQMPGGYGAMLSFHVAAGREAALQLVSRVRLFTRATSLGGVESLIEHRASSEGPDSPTPQDLIRASIGLEHVDDLIDDLRQALA